MAAEDNGILTDIAYLKLVALISEMRYPLSTLKLPKRSPTETPVYRSFADNDSRRQIPIRLPSLRAVNLPKAAATVLPLAPTLNCFLILSNFPSFNPSA